jgi:hypothetical protein
MGLAGYVTCRGKMINACIILGRNPDKLRNRWEDNIKMNLESGCVG